VNEMSETITIEIYIGYECGTWESDYIDIPAVSDNTINELIDKYMMEKIDEGKYTTAVFWGLYNIASQDDDD
jgi:hypothetical protein